MPDIYCLARLTASAPTPRTELAPLSAAGDDADTTNARWGVDASHGSAATAAFASLQQADVLDRPGKAANSPTDAKMSPVIELCLLTSDDWAEWRELRLAALAESPDAFSSTLEDWQTAAEPRWRSRMRDVPYNVIARRGNTSVGMVSARHASRSEANLVSLWVAPDARGDGVGDALVLAVLDWARTTGATSVSLDVREVNSHARSLYARHRFELVGPSTSTEGDLAEVQMRRTLEPNAPAR